jgi:hypothetical protein
VAEFSVQASILLIQMPSSQHQLAVVQAQVHFLLALVYALILILFNEDLMFLSILKQFNQVLWKSLLDSPLLEPTKYLFLKEFLFIHGDLL